MKNIEAIIFDLGGVILNIDYNLTRSAFEKAGVNHFDDMYSQSKADVLFKRLETGKITEEDFYTEFRNCTNMVISNEQIESCWNAMLLDFREETLLFLATVKPKYRTFLLSNTNLVHYKKFEKIYHEKQRPHTFEVLFEKAYYSFEMGLRKPDADCYNFVLEQNNLSPATTLFIDDTEKNIATARMLGMQTALLEKSMQVETLGL
ncbi:MAG: HAD family phosphatase [Bacteroidota bacterium]|nr:HAD family phosphatase [Bacteroidota bacterium]